FKQRRKEFDDRLVCSAFNWRRGQGQFERVAYHSSDGIFTCTRVNLDGEDDALAAFLHGNSRHRGFMLVLAWRQKLQCPRARRLNLLQLRLQNRATCPWRARPSERLAACGWRSGRAGRAAGGNKAARLRDLQ